MTTALPPAGSPIDINTFDGLRSEVHRLEIEEGHLLVLGWPGGPRLVASQRLARYLDDQLPDGLEAMTGFEVELAGPSPRRIPDVVVCTAEATDQLRVRADQIVLAVEVVSAGESAARGYIRKPAEYAANGIPTTWVIDIQEKPLSLTAYTLNASGHYHFSPPITGSYTGMVGGHEVTVELDALTGPRRRS